MADPRTLEAVESSDTDTLLRIIDGLCRAQAWDSLTEIRQLCADAQTRGKQLWGVDEHIRYRLALEAPAALAAAAVIEGPARFSLGPLTEVVASRHSFAELEPHLPPGPPRAWIAHERVLRGEVINAELDAAVVELPLLLADWEPDYPPVAYHPDRVEAEPPGLPPLQPLPPAGRGEAVDDPATIDALAALVAAWVEESNGRVATVCATGGLAAALRLLGVPEPAAARIDLATALALMAWAGASGGAHGRRRGGAAGRLAAWWVLHQVTGSSWPPSPPDLGRMGAELEWYAWSDRGGNPGWNLQLAVTSPGESLTWVVSANDAA